MQNSNTNLTTYEWRWLSFTSALLTCLAFVPFLIVAIIQLSQSNWAFMGALHAFEDVSAELSRARQGVDGAWLTHFNYTPEAHASFLLEPVYSFVGNISAFTNVPTVLIFHLLRLVASFFMYFAIYHLASTIWLKIRTRRIFFAVSALGSGLGWLYLIVAQAGNRTLDTAVFQAFPFSATLVNIHYPFTIACLALVASVLVNVLRPSFEEDPKPQNGGATLLVCTILITFSIPQTLIPILIATVIAVGWQMFQEKKFKLNLMRWLLWLLMPSFPVIVYYALVTRTNPVVSAWSAQQPINTVSIIGLLLGLGLLLVLALPSIWRTLRKFNPDGDRFMLLWGVLMLVIYYLPLPFSQTFLTGFVLALSYFITRTIEDDLIPRVSRRMRRYVFVFGVGLLSLTHIFVLMLPITPFLSGTPQRSGIVLNTDYLSAFEWISQNIPEQSVILAAPEVSLWLTVSANVRTVYGHLSETITPQERLNDVFRFYAVSTLEECADLQAIQETTIGTYQINYALLGQDELLIGAGVCIQQTQLIGTFGSVSLYQINDSSR
jgi:hypothetical protein